MSDTTMQALLDELSTGVADVVMAVESGNADATEMCKALVQAILHAKPQITVSPTPINVTHQAPESKSNWDFDFDYNQNGSIKKMRARRV